MNVDILFTALQTDSSWAGLLLGFILVLSIIFMGVKAFGKANMQLEGYGIMVLAFIGILTASIIGLFPTYIIVVFIMISLVIILFKQTIFKGGN